MTDRDRTTTMDCSENIPNDLAPLQDLDGWDVADGYKDPRGFDVMGRDNDKIGSIDSLLASPSTQKAYFAVVDTGGWFSSKKFAIPLTMVTLRDDDAYVPLTKDRFEDAPEWNADSPNYMQYCNYWQPGASAGTMDTYETAGAGYTGTGTGQAVAETGIDGTTGEMRVPVSEESVNVSKTMRPTGYVTLRKREEEYTKRISEPVTRTDVSVETRDVRPGEAADADTPVLRAGETLRVPVMEEQVNVETTPEQVTREVVVKATPRTETVEKDVTLRREVVDVDEEGDVNMIPPRKGSAPGSEARR